MSQNAEATTGYYDLDGAAVIWEAGKFPRFAASGATIYYFEKLRTEATPITKAEFDRLVALNRRT